MTAVALDPRALARRRARRRLTARPLSVLGALGASVAVLVALLAPLIAPYDPAGTNFDVVLSAPLQAGHALGTDQLGRDVLARMFYGAQASLAAGVLSTLLATVVAVPVGLFAGYYRRWVDTVISRVVDLVLAFPFLVLAVGLAAMFGPSLSNAIIALGVAQIPIVVRVVRAEVMSQRELEYVQAEVVNGTPTGVILFQRILPNVLNAIVVQASVTIPTAIVGAAILSFLGLGVQPPTADWGNMLAEAQNYLSQAPWLGVFPGVAIFLTTLSFNLLGDGIRDALDPRMLP
ncbi:ABC transporter permease [Pseudonocardia acaciae]|uniref:ABC transporter permease n=1 Tax=Pseudonocardia acaciae TaxID=551276 RepID=UPI00048D1CB0|nr:ABC transporter permease [Pseudonocardia acaciae]